MPGAAVVLMGFGSSDCKCGRICFGSTTGRALATMLQPAAISVRDAPNLPDHCCRSVPDCRLPVRCSSGQQFQPQFPIKPFDHNVLVALFEIIALQPAMCIMRSRLQKPHRAQHNCQNDFERSHPCSSTGRTSGACPGYVIDPVVRLKRGGADAPSNMQWQTTAEAKAKNKTE